VIADALLPAGGSWRRRGTHWTYVDPLGAVAGVVRATVRVPARIPGRVAFAVRGRGTYPLAATDLPLTLAVTLVARAGQCGEASLAACTIRRTRTRCELEPTP
jgi:hypothetical protein